MDVQPNEQTDPEPADDEAVVPTTADVVVVGAGLAGLTAAAVAAGLEVRGRRPRVVLLDARSDEHAIGGRARTDQRDGFHLNQGPRAVYRGGQARAILARLGLHPTGKVPPLGSSYGWRDGRLEPLPDNARRLVSSPMLGTRSKVRVGSLLTGLGRIDPRGLGGQSTAEWIAQLELRPDAEGLVTMLARVATYAADLSQVSADAGVRQVQLALGDGVDYLDDGWQQLVDGLVGVARARGADLRTGARVRAVTPSPDAGWTVQTWSGSEIRSGAVVLALGSPAATATVLADAPSWELGVDATAACLDLGLRAVPPRPIVFGIDRPLYLSTHSLAARLAPPGRAVVHLMRYGARTAAVDQAELWELAEVAGIQWADVQVERFLHRMVVAHGMPRPGSGLAGRPPVAVADRPGLFLAGDWVGHEGMLADASLASAERAAALAVAQLDRTRRPRPDLAGVEPMTDGGLGVFSAERGRLLGLAYRMTGSLAEAEDVVQDAWLRWSGADRAAVENPAAWLTTVTTRLSLDRLKAIDRRRADYVGQWLPEPVATTRGPEEAAEVADSLTLGFLVLLDRLTPLERAVFLLAEVFAEPYATIATTVDRRPDACRQIAARARRKLEEARRPGPGTDPVAVSDPIAVSDPGRSAAGNAEVLGQLVTAVLAGDVDEVMALLDPDVVLVSDGGPNRRAARQPVVGPSRVARLLINLSGRLDPVSPSSILELNDRPALRIEAADGPVVMQIEQVDGRVRTLWFQLNPEKLHGLDDVAGLR